MANMEDELALRNLMARYVDAVRELLPDFLKLQKNLTRRCPTRWIH